MESNTRFDLNTALGQWLDQLGRSAQVKSGDLVELESHIRDSVAHMQTKGLSAEESFLIATHRMGPAEKLETEYAKVNKNPMNKIVHGIILVCFGFASFCLYGMLMLMGKCLGAGTVLPWFSSCCFQLRSLCLWLPAIAAVYSVFVWFGKGPARATWTAFFAITTGLLALMTFPTLVAVMLPLMNVILHLSAR